MLAAFNVPSPTLHLVTILASLLKLGRCMLCGANTYPSVVSAGRDLLTGCVKTTGLSHLEETKAVAKVEVKERSAEKRRWW